jgi:hypothetical protein
MRIRWTLLRFRLPLEVLYDAYPAFTSVFFLMFLFPVYSRADLPLLLAMYRISRQTHSTGCERKC